MRTPEDPLDQTVEEAAERLSCGTVRFSIHFRPCSKKNETKPIRLQTRNRIVWKIAPTSKANAHEDAIACLALAELAWARGAIGAERRAFYRTMAAERAAGNVSRADLASLSAGLRTTPVAFPRDLVRLEIVEHIGRKPGSDWLDVAVTWLEKRPTRKRTGLGHDLVNVHAIVADALRGGLVDDDDQIVELAVSRVLD